MTRSHHHHHGCQQQHNYQQQQQQGHGHPDAILLGAAALGAAVNHYTHPPRQSTLITQQQQHPSSHPNPQDQYHPPEDVSYFYIRRQNQRLCLVNSTRLNTRPPGWRLQRHCEVCFVTFGLFNGRHHCRNCGRSVCGTHSTKRLPLPHWGFLNHVRVCDGCHDVVMNCFRTGAPYHPALLPEYPQHHQYQQQQVPQERLAFGQHWEGGVTTMAYAHPYTPVGMGVEEGGGGGMVGEDLHGNANVCVPVSGQYGQQITALPYADPVAEGAAAGGMYASIQQQQQQQHPNWPAQPSAPPLPGGDYYSLPPTTR